MRSYDETVKDFWGQKKEQALAEARQLASGLHAAAVSTSNLTNNPDFDRFLGYLQGAVEGAEGSRKVLLDRLGDPMLTDHAQVARLRAEVAVLGVQAATLRHVIALPADIQRDGEKARGLLERLAEKENADAA